MPKGIITASGLFRLFSPYTFLIILNTFQFEFPVILHLKTLLTGLSSLEGTYHDDHVLFVYVVLTAFFFQVFLDDPERLIGNDMFDSAGIFFRDFRIDTQ